VRLRLRVRARARARVRLKLRVRLRLRLRLRVRARAVQLLRVFVVHLEDLVLLEADREVLGDDAQQPLLLERGAPGVG